MIDYSTHLQVAWDADWAKYIGLFRPTATLTDATERVRHMRPAKRKRLRKLCVYYWRSMGRAAP